MCGVAGFNGIPQEFRLPLAIGLGTGIDRRGGDAIGFATMGGVNPIINHRLGEWEDAPRRFWEACVSGSLTMMHARFATCGTGEVTEAHPFTIRRNGRTVLWGAHNGVIYNARESAARNGRRFTVDSKEMFELLADGDIEAFNSLHGYGVITWIERGEQDHIKIARLTSNSDIVVAKVAEGGVAYASTWKILEEALLFAGLECEHTYSLDEIGRVYMVEANRLSFDTVRDNVKIDSGYTFGSYFSGDYGYGYDEDGLGDWWERSPSTWTASDREAFERWMASESSK